MQRSVRIDERIVGGYAQVAPILRLEFDEVIRAPLDEMRVDFRGGFIGRPVDAQLGGLWADDQAVTVPVRWEASRHPRWFPRMDGRLELTGAGRGSIDVALVGSYTIPFGILGALLDRLRGRRAANRSLRRYVHEVAAGLEAQLVKHAPPLPERSP